jgi:hypothetical protein
MGTTYMTNDQFAVRKNYANFAAFAADNEFPIEATLNKMRDDAAGIINEEIGVTSNISTHASYLESLEFRMVELMIDEAQGRATEEGRPVYIPRDYLYERDRRKLHSFHPTAFNRGVGN